MDAAAGMFPPVVRDGARIGWSLTSSSKAHPSWIEHNSDAEGQHARLAIGPGMVRLYRQDPARAERKRARLSEEGARDRHLADKEWAVPMVWANIGGRRTPQGSIAGWSQKSRALMIRTIASLDLAPLVTQATPPAMVTLTLPGDWLAVAPTAAAAAACFKRFDRAWSKKWGPLQCLWKREFQGRGAPHWHLWLVPPVPMGRIGEFREWLSAAWTRALQIPDDEERARSLRAGTGVDFAEGLRARDPKRLAVYFLKESLGGEGKAYQNEPPREWEGQSVGRYWGVRGIPQAVAVVALEPGEDVKVWRVMRKLREAAQRSYVEVEKVRPSGEVYTIVRRKHRRVQASAGWVASNDGPATAERLARYVDTLRPMVEGSEEGRALDDLEAAVTRFE